MGWEPRPQAAEGAGARAEPELRHPGASEHLRAAPRARGGGERGSPGRGRGEGRGRLASAGRGSGPRGPRLHPCPGSEPRRVESGSLAARVGSGQREPEDQFCAKESDRRV